MKIYRYLYYKLYRIWLKKKDEVGNAHINAVMTLTFLIYVNVMSIPLISIAVFKKEVIVLPDISLNVKIWIAGILIGVGLINYLLLGSRIRRQKIIKEFEKESNRQQKIGDILTILYLLVSLGIPLAIFHFFQID